MRSSKIISYIPLKSPIPMKSPRPVPHEHETRGMPPWMAPNGCAKPLREGKGASEHGAWRMRPWFIPGSVFKIRVSHNKVVPRSIAKSVALL